MAKTKAPLLFTFGHSTRSLVLFKETLRAHGVNQLIDIRTVPRSRSNPQFNKETLGPALRRARIGYRHLKGLGGLRHSRKDSPNRGWENLSFRGYADYMLTGEFGKNLGKLIELAEKKTVCIMCAESLPWRCHRRLVADALLVRGLEVRHIMSPTRAGRHTLTAFARRKAGRLLYPAEKEEIVRPRPKPKKNRRKKSSPGGS